MIPLVAQKLGRLPTTKLQLTIGSESVTKTQLLNTILIIIWLSGQGVIDRTYDRVAQLHDWVLSSEGMLAAYVAQQ